MGSSDVEMALKSGLKLMLQNKIDKGKTMILIFLKSKLLAQSTIVLAQNMKCV